MWCELRVYSATYQLTVLTRACVGKPSPARVLVEPLISMLGRHEAGFRSSAVMQTSTECAFLVKTPGGCFMYSTMTT